MQLIEFLDDYSGLGSREPNKQLLTTIHGGKEDIKGMQICHGLASHRKNEYDNLHPQGILERRKLMPSPFVFKF